MINIDELRLRAAGRWENIIKELYSGEIDFSGQHGPCPKCGGTDRFVWFRDGGGGCHCRLCHREDNGDGIATVMWLNEVTFVDAVKQITSTLDASDIISHCCSAFVKLSPFPWCRCLNSIQDVNGNLILQSAPSFKDWEDFDELIVVEKAPEMLLLINALNALPWSKDQKVNELADEARALIREIAHSQ